MTLIEIMVVILILGLIAAVVAFEVVQQAETARREKAFIDIRNLYSSIELYRLQRGQPPPPQEGLAALVRARVIRELPEDPWGSAYVYEVRGREPIILSYGGDGLPGGSGRDEDVILPRHDRAAPE